MIHRGERVLTNASARPFTEYLYISTLGDTDFSTKEKTLETSTTYKTTSSHTDSRYQKPSKTIICIAITNSVRNCEK